MTPEPSALFTGFHEDNSGTIRIPESFFTQLLPAFDKLPQLRLLLYMFWHIEQQEDLIRYFRLEELSTDPALLKMTNGEEALNNALQGLVNLGAVLQANLAWMDETYYFINSPQGRAAVDAIAKGEWQSSKQGRKPIHMSEEQPNIFKLYEENIGPITPLMAEILKEDEAAYPQKWVQDAIQIAVKRNIRNWKYIQAILERWQTQGRGNEQNRRDDTQDPSSYRKSWLGRE